MARTMNANRIHRNKTFRFTTFRMLFSPTNTYTRHVWILSNFFWIFILLFGSLRTKKKTQCFDGTFPACLLSFSFFFFLLFFRWAHRQMAGMCASCDRGYADRPQWNRTEEHSHCPHTHNVNSELELRPPSSPLVISWKEKCEQETKWLKVMHSQRANIAWETEINHKSWRMRADEWWPPQPQWTTDISQSHFQFSTEKWLLWMVALGSR